MSSTTEDGIQVTHYEAPSDINGILRAKDEINAKLTADLAQENADNDDLRASLTQQEQDIAIQGNVIDEQDDRIVDNEASLTKQMDEGKELERKVAVTISILIRKIKAQDAGLAIWERAVDDHNASDSSDSSGTDYDLMDRTSDEEEDEDINGGNGTSSATDNNGSDNSSAANIESEDETMDDI
ncbi:hypothetical protein FNAPI_5415 [Fusarium napiforme]|uniref:Uncharacterized protein n=1 Tax=Fusarium napiforme TaxID=42672 RepID=A0A8H5JL78_9HYPO|nr:hypothetical protein FNAPI_5415 [Fusarium napiforme]